MSDAPRPATTTYAVGPDVLYRLVKTGRTATEIAEVMDAARCPSCGADWAAPQSVRVGHEGGREYLCWTCMTFHRGVLVDDDRHPLPTPGWGLAQDRRRVAHTQSD